VIIIFAFSQKIKTTIMAQTVLPQNRVFFLFFLEKNGLPAIIIVVFI
jgi:hypothetical protein